MFNWVNFSSERDRLLSNKIILYIEKDLSTSTDTRGAY